MTNKEALALEPGDRPAPLAASGTMAAATSARCRATAVGHKREVALMRSKTNDPTGDVPAPTVRAILRAVRDAEVLYVAFPRLQRALIVDPRPGAMDYPAVLVAALGFGTGQQAEAVENLRPGQPPSDRAIAVTWGGSTRTFVEQGVLPAILGRLPAGGEKQAMAAFEELREAERGVAPALAHDRKPFSEKLDD